MPRVNEVYPSTYLTAADLHGQPRTCTVDYVEVGQVGQGLEAKSQLLVTFHEFSKQLGLNKTNAAAIAGLYGDDTDDWIGESIVLFPTRVDFQGKMVDAIRVDERQSRVLMQAKLKAQKSAPAARPAAAPRARATSPDNDREPGEDDDIPFN